MSKPPLVASFDIATDTGVCFGRVGAKPEVMTWNLREAGSGRPVRLAYLHHLCGSLFAADQFDVVCAEAPLSLRVAHDIGAAEDVLLFLRGAVGVWEAAAAAASITDIRLFSVQSARQHLTGRRTFPKDHKGKSTAKTEVMKMAKMLGTPVATDHEADAYAGWSLVCAHLNPLIAHLNTPLFHRSA